MRRSGYLKGVTAKKGGYVSAPGAPQGYKYGDTVICPKCGRKELVWRTKEELWKCLYVYPNKSDCGYYTSYYVGVRNMKDDIVGSKDVSSEALDFAVCSELLRGKALDDAEISEICGSGDTVRSTKSSLNRELRDSLMPGNAIEQYRRKMRTAG